MQRRHLLSLVGIAALLLAGSVHAQSRSTAQPTAIGPARIDLSAHARADAPSLGPRDAPVTVVEFLDPACEGCRAFHPYVKRLLAAYPQDVRLEIRFVPLHGEMSEVSIRVLEAARRQQRFTRVLDALFDAQPRWASHRTPQPELTWEIAAAAGLDVTAARRDVTPAQVKRITDVDMAAFRTAGGYGTPTFMVNGIVLQQLDPQALSALIRSELARTGR